VSLVSLHPIKAILFDLDGTLVHSSLNFKQIRKDINCLDGEDVLSFLDSLPVESRTSAEQIVVQHELNDACSSTIISGAAELLNRLAVCGLKTGIVTRNSAEATQIKVARCGLNIKQILTREDAPAKPDPSALLHFCGLWDLVPEECIYVGDYVYDIQAANNAKMHACLYVNEKVIKHLPGYAKTADFICRNFDIFEDDVKRYLASF
tara:strand:+ start:43585 stop:44205 length:621 start_codon:yes stop_codon:yes gene_type:complete